ncbi:MAG: amino acid permease [Planctomycetes bacterium]|nr:amino acid permease [Planctomycetota bacterium]
MFWNRIFATKTLEMLDEEAKGENRLRRVLGPVGLTSLGVGAIIGAGIFVMTGEVAANDAGPSVLLSYVVAAIACVLAAFCYSEFAAMAPVAGSAYTYAYSTLGEIIAWIIGWDLILEYSMAGAVVAAVWAKYLNKLLEVLHIPQVPAAWCNEPFTTPGGIMNLPGALILIACTTILVIGIRESAASNTALVLVKLGVVVFVIVVGVAYVDPANWYDIPTEARRTPEQILLDKAVTDYSKKHAVDGSTLTKHANALLFTRLAEKHQDAADAKSAKFWKALHHKYINDVPAAKEDVAAAEAVLHEAKNKELIDEMNVEKWGMIAELGLNATLKKVDERTSNNFMPYGISGVMLGAALVFFAFIGFDSISTHSEEAIKPQRDVPIGILASLVICTLLYLGVSAVITGMVPYPEIDTHAAIASAFTDQAKATDSWVLRASGGLIAAGALAGLTSVLLITFLSQARIFLAMARDGLMPHAIFGAVHDKFRTPHISTMLTGSAMALVAAFTPIADLEKMVNIGTLFAFTVVCAAVLILRIKRPDANRPFKCPAVHIVAPLGIAVNVLLMLFLPVMTWVRLFAWLALGMCIYFGFGYHYSVMREARPQD